jgi:hypothetical protein
LQAVLFVRVKGLTARFGHEFRDLLLQRVEREAFENGGELRFGVFVVEGGVGDERGNVALKMLEERFVSLKMGGDCGKRRVRRELAVFDRVDEAKGGAEIRVVVVGQAVGCDAGGECWVGE